MQDFDGSNWPYFKLVRLEPKDDWTGPPVTLQLPESSIAFSYQAAEALTVVEELESRRFLRFGSTGLFGSLLFDSTTGSIVEHQAGTDRVTLVNTSISAFNEITEKVIEAFPFYSSDGNDAEIELAAANVRKILHTRDPEAYFTDGFWEGFVSDIEMGDYTTEEATE